MAANKMLKRLLEEGTQGKILHVLCRGPLDYYPEYTMTLTDWLKRNDEGPSTGNYNGGIWELAKQAIAAVSQHSWFSVENAYEPCIGYDCKNDDFYFIFKVSDNGTTFLVSRYELPDDGEEKWADRMTINVEAVLMICESSKHKRLRERGY